jgi:hypothetical protein
MYGAQFVASTIATDMIIEMLVDGPALLLEDNNSVVLSTSEPSSILKKKHRACAYHCVC